jgi:hypothetical protein
VAGGILAVYGAWPGSLWGEPTDLGPFSLGVIWQPPNTNPATYYSDGDRPWFVEYHWHGIQLITGNAFVLGGLVLLAVLVVAALRVSVYRSPAVAASGPAPGSADRAGDQPADEGGRAAEQNDPAEQAVDRAAVPASRDGRAAQD